MAFDGFTPEERAWLASQRLGRLATVSPDGDGFSREIIRIHPDWTSSFGLPPAARS